MKRGGLYNCDQCVFNVTKLHLLYDHYRYSHMIEEPELKFPEESVIRSGHKDMVAKNGGLGEQLDKVAVDRANADIPMLWSLRDGSFTKVFKCRYCPHTNQRRHNTLEHEKMHSDHPEHSGGSATNGSAPQHPCKKCTYVCNNAGVLSSHHKVHAIGYSTVVGFCDASIRDPMQIKALEYVIELERGLDQHGYFEQQRGGDDSDASSYADEKDDPVLKFCQYCPARFFFVKDLECHVRFHRYRWLYACDCCSFSAREQGFVAVHEIVHRDEYENRTAELIRAYRISDEHPKPTEYTGDSPPPPTPPKNVAPVVLSKTDAPVEPTKIVVTVVPNTIPTRPSRPRKSYVLLAPRSTPPPSPPNKRRRPNENENYAAESQQDLLSGVKSPSKTTLAKSYIKQFKCTMCPGRFFKTTALQYHLTLHGGPGPHKCRSCDYAVSTYGNLIRHETVHEDLLPREKTRSRAMRNPNAATTAANAIVAMLPSPPKSKPTTSSAPVSNDAGAQPAWYKLESNADPEFGLQIHGNPEFYYPTTVKNGVAKEKRYKCPKCPSAFDKRDQYKVHLTLHGADDKYKCDKCDYSVKYTANYVQHQRKHALHLEMKNAASMKKLLEESRPKPGDKGRKRLFVKPTSSTKATAAPKPVAAAVAAPKAVAGPAPTVTAPKPAATAPEPLIVSLPLSRASFKNEISDVQTKYELDTAYRQVLKCEYCPFECASQTELTKHGMHHFSKRWKRVCAFCTYVTQTESDLTDHMRVHFEHQPSTTLAEEAAEAEKLAVAAATELAAKSAKEQEELQKQQVKDQNGEGKEKKDDGEEKKKTDEQKMKTNDDEEKKKTDVAAGGNENADSADEDIDDGNQHIEYHGKRVFQVGDEKDEEPFFVFKDIGPGFAGKIRFSPKLEPLIDYNDNSTKPTYIKFVNDGKRIEFVDKKKKKK